MTKDEIHELEMDNPVFKIKRSDLEVDGEHYYIQANSGGLYKYSQELIDIADQIEQETELTKIDFPKYPWIAGEAQIDYVEVVRHEQSLEALKNKIENNLKGDIIKYGCISVLLFLVIAAIVGIVTMVKCML